MSSYSDYLKSKKRLDMEFFFGDDLKMVSGKYFTFKRVKDNDNIVVLTGNIKFIKGNPILIVADNKGIYLKEWQIRKVASYQMGINCYAVKLSRQFFKPYTFSFEFEDFLIEEEYTFDKLLEIAKEQEKENLPIRQGWCG